MDKDLAQFTRCQLYGHTKSYCNRPYVCAKCADNTAQAAEKRARPPRQHVLYVEAIIPRAANVATIIRNIIMASTPTTDLLSHNAIHPTLPNNSQQTPDLTVQPMHRHYVAKDQGQLPPTWKSPCL